MALAMKSTFKSFDRLKESGVPAKQARVIVETIEEASDFNIRELTTKADLKLATEELRSETNAGFAEIRTEIKEMKGDIAWLKRLFMGGMLMILTNIIITLLHH